MALNTAGLQGDLLALFANPSPDVTALAEQWRAAMVAYASGIVPPSLNVTTAGATLKSTLIGIFGTTGVAQGAAMDAAFAAFAVSVAAGMLPTYTGVPPASPPGFVANLAPPFPTTHAAAVTKWAGILDTWMRTGTAVLVAPPNGVLPWT
jgi:hypothetical protein